MVVQKTLKAAKPSAPNRARRLSSDSVSRSRAVERSKVP